MQPMQNNFDQYPDKRHNSHEYMTGGPVEKTPAKRFGFGWFRRERQHKRVRIFSWWNLLAVIGLISVVVQLIRYVIVPLLVYLNVLTGGAL